MIVNPVVLVESGQPKLPSLNYFKFVLVRKNRVGGEVALRRPPTPPGIRFRTTAVHIKRKHILC